MATQKEIENLTIEEFMEGLDYAVNKKKRKIIKELKINSNIDVEKQNVEIHSDLKKDNDTKKDIYKRFKFDEDENIKDEDIKIDQMNVKVKNKTTSKKSTKKYNMFLLISFILGIIYILYISWYLLSSSGTGTNDAENVGIGIAIVLAIPHLICTFIAVLFNGLGLFMNKRGFALTGAILYTVSCVLMPVWFMFVIVQAVLSYIGFAKLPKKIYIPVEDR